MVAVTATVIVSISVSGPVSVEIPATEQPAIRPPRLLLIIKPGRPLLGVIFTLAVILSELPDSPVGLGEKTLVSMSKLCERAVIQYAANFCRKALLAVVTHP